MIYGFEKNEKSFNSHFANHALTHDSECLGYNSNVQEVGFLCGETLCEETSPAHYCEPEANEHQVPTRWWTP